MSVLRIGGAALNQTPIDWNTNQQNIRTALQQAQKDGINILCLPELCVTGYGCEDLFLHPWVAEKALVKLFELLPYTEHIAVCIGLPVYHENRLYNCACFIENRTILGFSAKQFLANEGVHYEPRWFTPWPQGKESTFSYEGKHYAFGDLTYTVQGIRIAFEICEDAWRGEERPGYRYAQQGIDLILNPSASHFAFHKSNIRYDIVVQGSERMNCTYIYADLLGNEAGRMIYDGEVLIAHQGKLIQRNNRLSFHDVELVAANIDFSHPTTNLEPLTEDERSKEFEFWEATCLGLFDYMRKAKAKGFVLSLSGGADSSTCAIMVYEMIRKGLEELGPERFIEKAGIGDLMSNSSSIAGLSKTEQAKALCKVCLTCVYQASRNSGEDTFLSAKELAESIGATFYHWSIDEEVEHYKGKIEEALQRPLTWEQDDIALQNIQARSRSPIIWMMANIKRALLITTSNRSEGDVGYATMDGDTSGSIAPLAGVDKDFIRNWLRWAEAARGHHGLQRVNQLTPTAELRPSEKTQTDEKDLMPYPLLAQIERLAIKERNRPLDVYLSLAKDWENKQELKQYIAKFFRLWSINQWKRERIAPSFHLDDFNVDPRSWCRFPILSGNYAEEIEALLKHHE